MKTAEQHLPFGDIIKTFGTNGELLIKLSNTAPQKINIKEPVFITIDGLPVPFYFKSFDERGNDRAIVIFDDIENDHLAESLVGKQLWLPCKKRIGKRDFDLNDFVGYTAIDQNCGELGEISEFLNYPGNPCFQIINNGKEIIAPINEDLITNIDTKLKAIYLNLPEGLVDFYTK